MPTHLRLLLTLIIGLGVALAAAACSSTTTDSDPEYAYDRSVRKTYLTDERLRFFDSRFKADRPEMDEYISAFSDPELTPVMKKELAETCARYGGIIGANLAYMVARAGITEIHPFVHSELKDSDRYVRLRAIRSINPDHAREFKADLLVLTGDSEPADDVREEARKVYRFALGADDYVDLYDQLGTDAAADDGFRQFLTTCLTYLMRELPAADREARLSRLASGLGQGNRWQDEFAFSFLQGRFPSGSLPALIRVYADSADGGSTLRRDVLIEIWRQVTQAGATVPADQAPVLRTALVKDLIAGRQDPDQLADLVRAVGLDDETTASLAEWLHDQELSGDSPSLGGVVAIRLLADALPPTAAYAALLIRAADNPALQELSIRALLRMAGEEAAGDDFPRDEVLSKLGHALRSESDAVRAFAANGLATLEDEVALEYLFDALRGDSDVAAKVAADVMVAGVPVERLSDLEVNLCDVIRLDGPRALSAYNVIAGLRVLEVCGGAFTLEFMSQYCKPGNATADVATVIERVAATIRKRVDGE